VSADEYLVGDDRSAAMARAKRERILISTILLMMAMTFLWIIAPDRICDVDPAASGLKGIIQHLEKPIRDVVAGARTEPQCVGRMTVALGLLLLGGGAAVSGLLLLRVRRGERSIPDAHSGQTASPQWQDVLPESVNVAPDSGRNFHS
jgi:hypothetical protein